MSDEHEVSSEEHDAAIGSARRADDHDWEWRRKIRANPRAHLIYRIVVGVVGLVVFVVGLILVPFPGPGWVVVFLGLGIWASEFAWAQRLLHNARKILDRWTELLKPQPWWVKGIVLLLTIALVGVILWLLLLISHGVPGYFPDSVENLLKKLPGLS